MFRKGATFGNADTFLDVAFLALIAVIAVRFVRTGGMAMLRMMDAPPANHRH